jgi:hypothetical protein
MNKIHAFQFFRPRESGKCYSHKNEGLDSAYHQSEKAGSQGIKNINNMMVKTIRTVISLSYCLYDPSRKVLLRVWLDPESKWK